MLSPIVVLSLHLLSTAHFAPIPIDPAAAEHARAFFHLLGYTSAEGQRALLHAIRVARGRTEVINALAGLAEVPYIATDYEPEPEPEPTRMWLDVARPVRALVLGSGTGSGKEELR